MPEVLKRKFSSLRRLIKQRRYRKILRHSYRNVFKAYSYITFSPEDGVKVVDEDWDTLLILDACRFDTFKQENSIQGVLENRTSRSPRTREWLQRNFPEENYGDIVYISANPYTENLSKAIKASEKFSEVYNMFDTHWNNDYGTVMPDAVSKTVQKARKKHPDKRIIAHYVQPHEPYIGEVKIPNKGDEASDWGDSPFEGLKYGNYDSDEFYKAYKSNLREVLDSIEKLLPSLSGKVIISADHGELFGEKGLYGHPAGIAVEELVKVPWFIVDRKEYSDREEYDFEDVSKGDEAEIKDKLEALGYGE